MTASIARYLKDFGQPQRTVPLMTPEFDLGGMGSDMGAGMGSGLGADDFDFPGAVAEEPKIDLEAERAEAYAQGHEAGAAEARQQWDEEKKALEDAYAAEMAALRERLEKQAMQTVEDGLNAIVTKVSAAVSDKTADVLVPFLGETLTEKAVDELAQLIRTAMLEGDVGTITVAGPRDMYLKLEQAFGENVPLLRHVEAADLDLSVDIEGGVLVTRLSAWAASLRKVLG